MEQETPKLSLSSKTSSPEKSSEEAGKSAEQNEQMNSLKCDDCGTLLKDEDFATLHAHKTGHVNFSQVIIHHDPFIM